VVGARKYNSLLSSTQISQITTNYGFMSPCFIFLVSRSTKWGKKRKCPQTAYATCLTVVRFTDTVSVAVCTALLEA